MKTAIRVKSNESVSAAYRKLVRAEWDPHTFDRILDLIDSQLTRGMTCWDLAHAGVIFEPAASQDEVLSVSARLRLQVEAFDRSLLPALAEQFAPRLRKADAKWWERLVRCCAALAIPVQCRLEGPSNVLLDSLSLLYLSSLAALVPKLQESEWDDECSLLWNIMWLHCQVAWSGNLAHQQYLLACLFRETNLVELEEQALRNSYSLTDVTDHDFLTKAQAVWACLLDQNRHADAREFVLQVARVAPQGALGELSGLLSETFVPARSA